MITTEINILEHIELLQDDIDIIKEYAETDAIEKLMKIKRYLLKFMFYLSA